MKTLRQQTQDKILSEINPNYTPTLPKVHTCIVLDFYTSIVSLT